MPLTNDQLNHLYLVARDCWLDAESTRYAYERAFSSSQRVSEWLKRGTIGAAALTAFSTLQPLQWLTAVVGVCTAIVASIDRMYSPASHSQKYWDCINKLDAVKKDLVTCAITLDESKELSEGAEPFNQIGARIPEIKNIPVSIEDTDRVSAKKSFSSSTIAAIIERLSQPGRVDQEDEPLELAADAPDIVATVRARRARQ